MKPFGLLLFCLLPFISFAQQKVYYNKLYQVVDSTQAFEYYETVERQANGTTILKQYAPSDSLIYQGAFSRFQVKDQPNIKEGAHKYYLRNGGALHYVDNYQNNKLHGERKTYYEGAILKRIEVYDQGEFVRGECYNEDGSSRTFTLFEIKPSFPGGEQALFRYLSEYVQYPNLAKENGIQGQVILTFVVNRDGSVSDVNLVKDIGGGCGEEAIRLIKAMPNWTPGYFDDKPVKVRYTLPIKFKLEGRSRKKRKKD